MSAEDMEKYGYLPEDFEDDAIEVWPENQQAAAMLARIGTRWLYGPSGVAGFRWEAIYPLMDRLGLKPRAWDELLLDLEVMESVVLSVLRKK
jgi:hypothetical protein